MSRKHTHPPEQQPTGREKLLREYKGKKTLSWVQGRYDALQGRPARYMYDLEYREGYNSVE